MYRNLQILNKWDIIQQVTYKDEQLYELKIFGKKSIHTHIVCVKCNSIIDYIDLGISLKTVEKISEIKDKYFFDTKNVDIMVRGVCENCLKNGR